MIPEALQALNDPFWMIGEAHRRPILRPSAARGLRRRSVRCGSSGIPKDHVDGRGIAVRAGGALAVFLLLYLLKPRVRL
jgi:hypothetical protein